MLQPKSGGLLYHFRATRYRPLWQPFVNQVGEWLANWQLAEKQLLIIGSSAGYSLPETFLRRFESIHVCEPDKLSFYLLQKRFSQLPLQHQSCDFLSRDGLAKIHQQYPETAILFSNVLGQVAPPSPHSWHQHLREALAKVNWASYHDVISTQLAPDKNLLSSYSATSGDTLAKVIAQYWSAREIVLHDHDCFGLQRKPQYAIWQLLPKRWHLIEWVMHSTAETANQRTIENSDPHQILD